MHVYGLSGKTVKRHLWLRYLAIALPFFYMLLAILFLCYVCVVYADFIAGFYVSPCAIFGGSNEFIYIFPSYLSLYPIWKRSMRPRGVDANHSHFLHYGYDNWNIHFIRLLSVIWELIHTWMYAMRTNAHLDVSLYLLRKPLWKEESFVLKAQSHTCARIDCVVENVYVWFYSSACFLSFFFFSRERFGSNVSLLNVDQVI